MNHAELFNKFNNLIKIKTGGQKVVYSGYSPSGEKIALKLISNVDDKRVLQEISILNDLHIDNIPIIIESGIVKDDGIDSEYLYIVEKFIDGISLRDWLKNGNKADISLVYKILYALIEIEIELEKRKILHRDINPNNIILGADDNIYLIDFGLAKISDNTSLTKTIAMNGPCTPGYAPFEQFANKKSLQDVRTDLFQIGVTVYEVYNGKNPFLEDVDSPYEALSKTVYLTPPTLEIEGDNNGLLSNFINMLMAKNQSQRPNSAFDAMRYLKVIEKDLSL